MHFFRGSGHFSTKIIFLLKIPWHSQFSSKNKSTERNFRKTSNANNIKNNNINNNNNDNNNSYFFFLFIDPTYENYYYYKLLHNNLKIYFTNNDLFLFIYFYASNFINKFYKN